MGGDGRRGDIERPPTVSSGRADVIPGDVNDGEVIPGDVNDGEVLPGDVNAGEVSSVRKSTTIPPQDPGINRPNQGQTGQASSGTDIKTLCKYIKTI